MEIGNAVVALTALAQAHRLEAFRFLVQQGPDGAAAGTIARHLGIPPSSLSFHLAHLERAHLVIRVRRSRSLVYSADFSAMSGLVTYLTENCCGGDATCTAPPDCIADRKADAA